MVAAAIFMKIAPTRVIDSRDTPNRSRRRLNFLVDEHLDENTYSAVSAAVSGMVASPKIMRP